MSQASELEQATIEYETARANYSLAVQDPENADVLSAEAQLAQARASLAKLLETPKESEIAAAEAQLAQARANLAKLLEDPKEPDIMAAQSSVESALVGLEQAQLNLDRATLETSISGVVSEVNIKVGEDSTYLSGDEVTSRSAVTILDLSAFHIEVDIDEIDIGRIVVGQNVVIILDAIPDVEFEGHVSSISPGPIATSSGVVAYQVSVDLDSYDSRLLPGMTANTTIETDRLEDIVVVPNRAVRIERENGSVIPTVDKLNESGKPVRQEIELGLRNDTVSQVLSGLEEGDKVVIVPQSRREQLQQVFQGGD
jgi:HlyD family secretion protein